MRPALVPFLAANLAAHFAAQPPAPQSPQAPQPPHPTFQAALTTLLTDPAFANARVGVHVVDLATNQTLLEHDATNGFMTGSNMKLISSAVALRTLGPDFTFTTRLLAHGTIRDGVLDGDLLLVGSGDPTLGGRHEPDGARAPFLRMARRLLDEHGIRVVTGAVLGDDDCQPDEPLGEGWSWNYEAADYAAPPSGLCFAENVVRIELLAATAGRPGYLLAPETQYLTIDNAITVASDRTSRTSLEVDRARGGQRVTLRGRLAAGVAAHEAVSVDNPTAFAACVLRECLLEAGIRVRGPAADRDTWTTPLPAASTVLAEHRSPPLREILVTLNKVSQNLYAEQIVRAAASQAPDQPNQRSMRAAARHATATLRELGVDVAHLEIIDGSGLTRLNLVQPRQFTALLAGMWRSDQRDTFVASLPIAGVDGTLANRMRETAAQGRVRAKTGFISRVAALSGYIPRRDPAAPPLAFSILTNNFTVEPARARQAIDEFVVALVGAAER